MSVTRDTKIHPSSKSVAVEINFVFLWWMAIDLLKECKTLITGCQMITARDALAKSTSSGLRPFTFTNQSL